MGFEVRSVSLSIGVLATVPRCPTVFISINSVLGLLHIILLILTTILDIGLTVSISGGEKTESKKTGILSKGTF